MLEGWRESKGRKEEQEGGGKERAKEGRESGREGKREGGIERRKRKGGGEEMNNVAMKQACLVHCTFFGMPINC